MKRVGDRRPSDRRPRVGALTFAGATLAFCIAAAALLPRAATAQAPPPDADWRTFSTDRFRVTYEPALEPLARRAAAVAERAYGILRDEIGNAPAGPIDLLVTDHVDYSNGLASYFPSSRITVYARPPAGVPQLAFSRDWLELVVVHELVHIFHMEETGQVGRAVRAVLGRVPVLWPVFPAAGSPAWNVEGLATYYESRITGGGRIPGSFHDMIIRTAALESRIPDLDDVSDPHPAWPGGQRSYGYGSRLMEYIAERYGDGAHRAIIEATGGSIRPTFLFFDHVAEEAVGRPFDDIYDDWRRQATADARALAERETALGVTATEPVTGDGPYAVAPRVSPGGHLLSFASDDYRSVAATRLIDLASGRTVTLAERNQFGAYLGPAAWLPDGSAMIVAQLERQGPYRVYSDLWRLDLDGPERRLTDGLRLAQPDVAPDGRRVAAVQSHDGGIRLVVHDLESGQTRVVGHAAPGEAFDAPRWSPAGDRIAAGHYRGGRVDIAVVDASTGAVRSITDDDALDLTPTWSPDGRWILWMSDRSGIPNILAASADPDAAGALEGGVRQVTRVLTGAFDPEVSPDGRTLYISAYHHDGWRIEALALDPALWTVAAPASLAYGAGLLAAPESPAAAGVEEHAAGGRPDPASSGYAPWPTVRPYYWLPEWNSFSSEGGSLRFLGLSTGGSDLVGRHEWSLAAALELGSGRFQGRGRWTYRRLAPLELTAWAERDWSHLGTVDLPDGGAEAIYRRTDELSLDAFLVRPRWRGTSWLRLGVETEWRENVPHDMSPAELRAAGWELRQFDPTVGVSGGPGFSNARRHAYSISGEEGVSGSISVGRWWNTATGARAYDELSGRMAGYLDFRGWGFADHVLAARVATVMREGDEAFTRSIGGIPTGSTPVFALYPPDGSFLPVRGYDPGARYGTRAWAASAEWRFPIHVRPAPGGILGFSLTSVAGSVFADAGDAWCSEAQRAESFHLCAPASRAPLASAGAELVLDFGAYHNASGILRLGVAETREGGTPVVYAAFGTAF